MVNDLAVEIGFAWLPTPTADRGLVWLKNIYRVCEGSPTREEGSGGYNWIPITVWFAQEQVADKFLHALEGGKQ